MSELGVIVKDASEEVAQGAEKAGGAIIKHFGDVGGGLKDAAQAYRGVEADAKQGMEKVLEGGAKDAEQAAGDVGKDTAQTVGNTVRNDGGQAVGETEKLAAETEQEAAEDAHLHGESGATEDPIDVVTGEMFLPQRDLALPGTLPVLLDRRHGSSYPHGRWFGATWSSTLDQRLEIDDDGIHFAAADGRVLHYPVPTVHGQQVMPSFGPRWPLVWDRKDDVITVEQGEAGWRLHFPPGPTPLCRPLSAITDRAGNRVTFVLDAEGTPTDVYHSGGYHVVVESIETRGGVRVSGLRLVDPQGGPDVVVRRFRYDVAGRLIEVVNASGKPLAFAYDDADRITQWTDRNGYSYRYHYRADGRVERAEGDGGYLAVSLAYDLERRRTTVTDALGNATVHHWDDRLHAVRVTDPLGHSSTTERDQHGQVSAYTDELGHTVRIARNAAGDAERFERPDGSTVTLTHTPDRRPLTVTGPDGAAWSYAYGADGLPSAITDPTGAVVRMGRGPRGQLEALTDPLGHTTAITCDAAGLPLEVTDPLGAVMRVRRDRFGRVAAITDALGAITRLAWDSEGNLLGRTHPDGTSETWEYDAEGNLLAYTSASGARTAYEYGPFDTAVARLDPDGSRYTFAYDVQLRLTEVTNPLGHKWTYTYNEVGLVAAETDFDGATITYRHDEAGHLVSRINAAGQETRYVRDALGRVIERHVDDAVYTYTHDAAGQLAAAEGPGSTLSYTRDALGRVLTETVNGRTVTSVYDAAGNRIARTTPGGVLAQWSFDANRRPSTLTGTAGTLAFGYDAAGRETNRSLGAGASLTQSFDELGRLTGQGLWAYEPTSQTAAQGGWRNIATRTYTYRPDGLPIHVEDTLRTGFDLHLTPSGRVTAINGANWRETYAYDALGNLTLSQSDGVSGDADGPRETLGTRTTRAGNIDYTYDACGRVIAQTRRTLSGQKRTWTYAWDADDHLVELITPEGRRWRYTYDPLGRRIAKEATDPDGARAQRTEFAWDGPRLAEEYRLDLDGTACCFTWDYLPGTFIPAAQTRRSWAIDAPQEQIDVAFHAIVADLSGAPAELVAPDGTVAWHTARSLWGKTITAPGSSAQCPLGFPGQYHDEESGLDYNLNRYYNPDTAAYLTPDPLGLAPAPNHHGYAPNPYVLSDPLGLQNCARQDPAWGGRVDFGQVDSLGRPTGVSATIEKDMIGKGTSAAGSIRPPGFRGGRPIGQDARGHLLGRQLGGSGDEPRNLVTLYQNPVNTPVMSGFEAQVRKAVEGGEKVEYKATPIYDGTQLIPRAVTLEAHGSGGFHLHVTILNRKP